MPRVGGRFEALVRAIQTENSLGNEALNLHSMNCIISQQSLLQPDHKAQNTDSVENLGKLAGSQASKSDETEWFLNLQRLGLREFTTLIQAKESSSKTLKPTTFENLTNLELSKRYNAQLSSQKRTNAASANYPKHKTQRKLKMPRVFGLLELFVSHFLFLSTYITTQQDH